MIPKELKDILVCPACHGELEEEEERLTCTACGLRYPVLDGVPVMLIEEATRE